MNKYRFNNQNHPRSVDGFIPSTPRIGEQPKAAPKMGDAPIVEQMRPLDEKPKTDGFQGQQRLDSLPSLQPYSPSRPINPVFIEPPKVKKRVNKKKVIMRSSLALVVFTLLFGGFFFGKIWLAQRKVLKGGTSGALALNSQVKPELLNGEGDGRVNILILGKGGENHPGGDLTDSILIASVDPIAKEASLLSIPRDLWVSVPDYWSMKINAVYSTGKQKAISKNENDAAGAEKAGVDLLDGIIKDNIGIPINYYVMVDFTAFKEAVDAVGGIDITVPDALYDGEIAWENNNNPLIAAAGPQHMDGKKALLYARSRYTSSDFARGQRQRDIAVSLKEKVVNLGTFSNPLTISKLIDSVSNNVTTNLSLKEMSRVYDITKDIPSTSIASIGFTDQPNVLVKTDDINGQSVVVPRRGLNDFSEIQSFVRNSLRDGFLKSENATVVVLNGTDIVGLGTKRADELKSYGYNVVMVDNAPTTDYANTELIDFTDALKKYTKRYLEQRLKTTAITSSAGIDQATYNADFVIIVGNNENTTTSP